MRKKTQISTCSKNHCPDMATFLGGTVVGTMVGILASRLATRPSGQKDASPNPDLNPAPVQVHTDLLRAISHDLRTPLSNIMGNSLIYLENHGTLEEQERLRLVSRIHEDSSWLIDMAENLLAITRLEDIGLLLSAREEIVEEVLSEALQKLEKRHPNSAVHVAVPESIILLPMDAVLIEQAVINLLENALLHSSGEKDVDIIVEDGAQEVTFLIRDYGDSIPENQLESCFDCASSRTSDAEKRSSVGLALSKTIIAAHQGTIRCRNHEKGAEFVFTLPKRRCDSL
ncbi:MAG: sensor histidine kinase [Lachnospiraceae bacterium]|jgi:two-component system sensor histidine kinase KdpD|uniref:sensor histidine kinase n=1 Tax=uncultured Acetatifactor sp. TaxID=1671927 RepID=UPI00262E2CAC|nr:ATP-binding protein [uncultured Acetatifactor sp.]MCI8789518.1 sensor histidine kinase [Lachnospiraceae bacterium]